MKRDLADLRHTGRLVPLAPVRAQLRRPRSQLRVVATGVFASGLAVGLPVFAVAAFLQGRTTTGVSALAQGALVGSMWGLLFGVPAALFPGILVGLYLQRREFGRRLAAERQQAMATLSQVREDLRLRLELGRITPQQAAEEISRIWPFAPRLNWLESETQQTPGVYPLPLPPAGEPAPPLEVLMLASAAADWSGGYLNVDHGANSTSTTVLRVLQDPEAAERNYLSVLRHNELEAMEALRWVAVAPEDDPYRQRLRSAVGRAVIDPCDRAGVTLVTSAIGALRRAKTFGFG